MATLLLSAAGGGLGGALFGPVGAIAGRIVGALGGAVVDRALFTPSRTAVGPRLTDLDVMSSTEGAPIPRLYGRARLSGQVIWATPFEEVVSTQTQSAGGKGGALAPQSTTTTYSYFGNFAVGLCEGPISRIGRIWADGKLLDTQGLQLRTHTGAEDQLPDPLIAAKQGVEGTPAYRGLAYIVFERLPLADFGNRLPQLMIEVERAVGALEARVTAVTLIPGATEFGYETREVKRVEGPGRTAAENRHTTLADTDFEGALDHLQALCPALESVALVVAWFGNDLRAGECTVRPGVEVAAKPVDGGLAAVSWSVAGIGRAGAHLVSRHEGRPAYGGTPSDESVRRAVAALKARGLKVTLYPFVMMDIPPDNALPDPWTGAAPQPAYPWRGRITCHPAPGQDGSPDATAAAADQVAALFGTAAPDDFGAAGGLVTYAGPAEWTLRRMVLHYAKLAVLAGGVDAILVGSEMDALTRVRSGAGVYPAAAQFAALAADVKSIVGAETLVSYAANWTEYGAHVPATGELRFPLDPLWASEAIDFVGIDWYPPLADWRDGDAHADAGLFETIYDPAYLGGNICGGEAFDWYYTDEAARQAQTRSAIADGGYGEPWVFRQKDLAAWWGNAHFERVGGERLVGPTGWVAGAKPVRLMEVGCAAVDKGANQPSTFPDPKSSESGYPPFSSRRRDDQMQRSHLTATLDAFATDAVNPPAPGLPGGRMADPAAIHLWTWDARPWPAFPLAGEVWADGANWEAGHWLNGRFGAAPLADLAATLCADFGIDGVRTDRLAGVVDGYVVDRPMSARAALEPLARLFGFDLAEHDGGLELRPRGGRAVAELGDDDLVARDAAGELRLVRGAESELPLQVSVGFLDAMADYRRAAAASRRLAGTARTEAGADLALVTTDAVAEAAAESWLQDLWATRDTFAFALPPSQLALEAGDVATLTRDGRTRLIEITAIEDAEARAVSARSVDPAVFARAARAARSGRTSLPPAFGRPELMVLTLPALDAAEPAALLHVAAFAAPWPGALAVWRAVDGASFERIETIPAPAVMGTTLGDLAPGPVWRFDRTATLDVELYGGALAAASEDAVLGGANALELVATDGEVEVIQFAEAELIGERSWRLSNLLRGQLGTETRAAAGWPAGTKLVRLDQTLRAAASGIDLLGRSVSLRVGRADRDQGDPDVAEASANVGGLALTPYAPVHARARRGPDGVMLSWIRRARINADSWEAAEIPLGEEREAYRLELVDGETVRRTVETTSPAYLYASADEVTDFGGPQTGLRLRIAQMSATVGPGRTLDTLVAVN